MDLNHLLAVIVAINAVAILIAGRAIGSWRVRAMLLLVVLGAGYHLWPDWYGVVAATCGAPLILIPALLDEQFARSVTRRQFRLAAWLIRLRRLLLRQPDEQGTVQFLEAMARVDRGDVTEGLQALRSLARQGKGSVVRAARLAEARLTNEWEQYAQDILALGPRWESDLTTAIGMMTALGESGRTDDVIETAAKYLQLAPPSPRNDSTLALYLVALTGDVELIDRLVHCGTSLLHVDQLELLRATALQVAGHAGAAQPVLNRLADSRLPTVQAMAQHRLEHPLKPHAAHELRPNSSRFLQWFQRITRHDLCFAIFSTRSRPFPWGIWLLVAALALNFITELPGGTENVQNLMQLGALILPLEPGQERTVVTSGFLHFGWPHLVMNLLGLLYLGRRLERGTGHLFALFVFAAAVFVSGACVAWLHVPAPDTQHVYVGASGGVMGLMGGLIGHLAVGRLIQATPLVNQQFRILLLFVGMGVIADISTPHVSMAAHLYGLATGIVLGIVEGAWASRFR